jgi:hypothetical protein
MNAPKGNLCELGERMRNRVGHPFTDDFAHTARGRGVAMRQKRNASVGG